MLLAIDIGNTHIVIGGIEDGSILYRARIATDRTRTSDQYGVEIRNLLESDGYQAKQVDGCIISSVVPPVFNAVRSGIYKTIGKQPMVIGPGLKTGLNIQVENPSRTGSDRIVAAVSASIRYGAPLILIDMGTATTMDVIEPDNCYIGGVIIPGARVSLDALISRTAQLPGINMDCPRQVISKNTDDAMRSGIMYGTAAMLDGMIDRMQEELGYTCDAVATGGVAPYIVPLCRHKITLDRDLMLRGLYEIYQMNQ